jgi:hypothetical protein
MGRVVELPGLSLRSGSSRTWAGGVTSSTSLPGPSRIIPGAQFYPSAAPYRRAKTFAGLPRSAAKAAR